MICLVRGNYEIHTFGTNNGKFDVIESDSMYPDSHTFSFSLNKNDLKFKPYNEYIEFALISYGTDKHKFTDFENLNIYSSEDALSEIMNEVNEYENINKKFSYIKYTILAICVCASVFIITEPIRIEKRYYKKYKIYEPNEEFLYYRDIPSNLDPCFAENLVFCREKNNKKAEISRYSAILLSLVRKKYIEFERIDKTQDWIFNNIKIVVKHKEYKPFEFNSKEQYNNFDNKEPLSDSEKAYFNLITRYTKDNEISMIRFQENLSIDYENTNTFIEKIEKTITNVGVKEGYYQSANYKKAKQLMNRDVILYRILAFVFIVIINWISYYTKIDFAYGGFTLIGLSFLIISFIVKEMSKKFILLTQYGEDEYVKWVGLYKFLKSETLMDERTVVELPLWEMYLIYATAFGISKKVVKALRFRDIDLSNSEILRNPYYSSNSFHHTLNHELNNATIAARNSYVTSKYFSSSSGYGSGLGYGGGFGYGGGGRGGGGGRRWSLR